MKEVFPLKNTLPQIEGKRICNYMAPMLRYHGQYNINRMEVSDDK